MPDDTITSPVTWGILDCLASSSDAIKSIQSNRYLDIYTASGNLNIGTECPSGRILTRVQIFDNTIKCCINLYHHHRAREQQTWPKPDQAHFSDFSEIGGRRPIETMPIILSKGISLQIMAHHHRSFAVISSDWANICQKKIIITISQLQWKCRVNTYKNGNNRTLIKLYCSQFLTRFLQPFADVVAFVSLTLLIYLTINLKYRLDVGCRMSPYLLLGC